MKFELTQEQGQTLITLLDVATKSGGLQVAEASLFFVKMIQEAAKAMSVSAPVVEEVK